MLYCPKKDEIDPRDLGLGKMRDDAEEDALPVEPALIDIADPLGVQQQC